MSICSRTKTFRLSKHSFRSNVSSSDLFHIIAICQSTVHNVHQRKIVTGVLYNIVVSVPDDVLMDLSFNTPESLGSSSQLMPFVISPAAKLALA